MSASAGATQTNSHSPDTSMRGKIGPIGSGPDFRDAVLFLIEFLVSPPPPPASLTELHRSRLPVIGPCMLAAMVSVPKTSLIAAVLGVEYVVLSAKVILKRQEKKACTSTPRAYQHALALASGAWVTFVLS